MKPLVTALAAAILILTTALVWATDILGLSGSLYFLILLTEALLYFGYLVLILPEEKRAKKRRIVPHPFFREALNADPWGQLVRPSYRPARGCLIKVRRKRIKYPFLCHSPLVERLRFFPLARWYWEWRSDD